MLTPTLLWQRLRSRARPRRQRTISALKFIQLSTVEISGLDGLALTCSKKIFLLHKEKTYLYFTLSVCLFVVFELPLLMRVAEWCISCFAVSFLLCCTSSCLLFASLVFASESEDKLKIATYASPPYQYLKSGTIRGSSVNTVKCVLQKMEKDYSIELYPQKRALHKLRHNAVDAVLSISEFHKYVSLKPRLSKPIALEKWYIFGREKNIAWHGDVSRLGRVGVVLGSSQEQWLLENNIETKARTIDLKLLLNMLIFNRVDTIIADHYEVYSTDYVKEIKKLEGVKRKPFRYTPKLVAFSENFYKNNPGFISEFDRNISGCRPLSMLLSSLEKSFIHRNTSRIFDNAMIDKKILAYLKNKNTQRVSWKNSQDLMSEKWSGEVESGVEDELMKDVLRNSVSESLREIKKTHNGVIREIIVTDKMGYNAAITDVTTDFYQGDEEKYSSVMMKEGRSHFISDIEYDESTNTFLVHVSFLVLDDLDRVLGVFVIGVDIRSAIHNWTYSQDKINEYLSFQTLTRRGLFE